MLITMQHMAKSWHSDLDLTIRIIASILSSNGKITLNVIQHVLDNSKI